MITHLQERDKLHTPLRGGGFGERGNELERPSSRIKTRGLEKNNELPPKEWWQDSF